MTDNYKLTSDLFYLTDHSVCSLFKGRYHVRRRRRRRRRRRNEGTTYVWEGRKREEGRREGSVSDEGGKETGDQMKYGMEGRRREGRKVSGEGIVRGEGK